MKVQNVFEAHCTVYRRELDVTQLSRWCISIRFLALWCIQTSRNFFLCENNLLNPVIWVFLGHCIGKSQHPSLNVFWRLWFGIFSGSSTRFDVCNISLTASACQSWQFLARFNDLACNSKLEALLSVIYMSFKYDWRNMLYYEPF